MILHTVLCKEQIFPCDEVGIQEMMIKNGTPMIVEKMEGKQRIIRIISTDPNDYLTFTPGMYIE